MAVDITTLQPAFILHTQAHRESSLVLKVFSAGAGRVDLLALGARRASRKKSFGALPLFQPLLIGWQGRGQWPILTQAEANSALLPGLKRHYLASAFYLNELLLRLLPLHVPEPRLFQDYKNALIALASQAAIQPILRIFEKRLLNQLGYGLNLSEEVETGQPLCPHAWYLYQWERGAVPYQPNQPKVSGIPIQGASLLALAQEQLEHSSPQTLQEIKNLMRTILSHYLGARPLYSRELLAWPTPLP